ncbi:glycosyltransferase, partial [Serratia marcescens]
VNTLYAPYSVGGAEISVQILCEELAKQGHQVRVITLCDKKKRELTTIKSVDVVYLPLKNIYWPFNAKKQSALKRFLWHFVDNYNFFMRASFRKEVLGFKPDVIHTNNLAGFSVAIWSVAHALGIGIVHTSRDYYLLDPNTTLNRNGIDINSNSPIIFLWSIIKRIHSKKIKFHVGISRFIMDFYSERDFFNNACCCYIYNPVSPHFTHRSEGQVKRLGFIGRHTKEKGFDTFCNIIIQLRESGHTFSAFSAGEYRDSNEAAVLQSLAKLADIQHLGRVNLAQFLNEVDIVILPFKWREPFGRVVVESALANKCVLINPVGGVKELIENIPTVKEMTFENLMWAMSLAENIEPGSEIIKLFDVRKITDEYMRIYER